MLCGVFRDLKQKVAVATEERPQIEISKKNPVSEALPSNKYFWGTRPSEDETLRIRRHEFVREFKKLAEHNSLAERVVNGEKLEVILQEYELRRQVIRTVPNSEQRKPLQREFNQDLEDLAELIPGIERGYSLLSLEEKVGRFFHTKGDEDAGFGRVLAGMGSFISGLATLGVIASLGIDAWPAYVLAGLSGAAATYTGLVTGSGKLRERYLQKHARKKAAELDTRKEKAFSYIESLPEEEHDRPMMDTDYGAPPVVLSRNSYNKENLHDRLQFVEEDVEERIKYGELTPGDGNTERLRRMRKLFDDTFQANESYSDLLQGLLQASDVSNYINSLNAYRKRPVWQLWKKEIAEDQERRLGELSYLIPIGEGPSPQDMAMATGMGIGMPIGFTAVAALLGLATGTFAELVPTAIGVSSVVGAGGGGIITYSCTSLSDTELNYVLGKAREVGYQPNMITEVESKLLSEETQKSREIRDPDLSWLHENSS